MRALLKVPSCARSQARFQSACSTARSRVQPWSLRAHSPLSTGRSADERARRRVGRQESQLPRSNRLTRTERRRSRRSRLRCPIAEQKTQPITHSNCLDATPQPCSNRLRPAKPEAPEHGSKIGVTMDNLDPQVRWIIKAALCGPVSSWDVSRPENAKVFSSTWEAPSRNITSLPPRRHSWTSTR